MTHPHQPVVGVDVGLRRLAYSWPYWGLAASFDLKKPGLPRDVELRMMQDWLVSKLPTGAQLYVDQAFAGQGAVAVAQRLTETIAAVMTAQQWVVSPVIVHQATWKSQIIGNHMAGKDEINAWLLEHRPDLHQQCSTEDEVDATVIGLYGQGRVDGSILAPEPKKAKRRKAKA